MIALRVCDGYTYMSSSGEMKMSLKLMTWDA
jgi:hypothetical protein